MANASLRGRKRRLDAFAEEFSIDLFVTISLCGTYFMQRLVDVRADIAYAILARARKAAHPAPEQYDGGHHKRNAGENEQRQLDARQHQHDEAADHQQGIANRHRCR